MNHDPSRSILRAFLLLMLSLTLLACAATGEVVPETSSVEAASVESAPATEKQAAVAAAPKAPKTRRAFIPRIDTYEEFSEYADVVAGERFTKAIIDLRTDKVYYFDVNVYPLHSDFIFAQIYKTDETPETLSRYMENYNETKPEFLLIYLVHHVAQDIWAYAFWEGDMGRAEYVAKAYERIQATFFEGDKVKFRPDSSWQEEVAAQLTDVPVVTNDEIYEETTWQFFNEGKRVGKLRIIDGLDDAELANLVYDKDEILILNEAIPTLTVVSGVISETFSTPLSHVALRARTWGIPHIGLKNASVMFKQLAGQNVLLEATQSGYELRKATRAEVTAWKTEKKKARTVQLPPLNLEQKELKALTNIRMTETNAYGAKTSNLGEIVQAKVEGCFVPEGFGIPIHYYEEHMKKHGLDKKMAKMIKGKKFKKDAPYRRDELAKLRAQILAKPIDSKLLDEVTEKVKAMNPPKGVFVRSSTNAEDLPGFNGAGLYDTIAFVQGRENLEKAVKQVWASVWNQRAFEERDYFGIDHTAVKGAVLVQKAVNPTAAGVLVTSNIYDKRDTDVYTINAKSGLGIRVVEGKKMPEQILFDVKRGSMKVLSRSDEDTMLVAAEGGGVKEVPNPAKNEPVLTHARARILSEVALRLTEVFPKENPLDIEWLFVGDALQIVQSRPFMNQ
jgi:hypothetical protein